MDKFFDTGVSTALHVNLRFDIIMSIVKTYVMNNERIKNQLVCEKIFNSASKLGMCVMPDMFNFDLLDIASNSISRVNSTKKIFFIILPYQIIISPSTNNWKPLLPTPAN